MRKGNFGHLPHCLLGSRQRAGCPVPQAHSCARQRAGRARHPRPPRSPAHRWATLWPHSKLEADGRRCGKRPVSLAPGRWRRHSRHLAPVGLPWKALPRAVPTRTFPLVSFLNLLGSRNPQSTCSSDEPPFSTPHSLPLCAPNTAPHCAPLCGALARQPTRHNTTRHDTARHPELSAELQLRRLPGHRPQKGETRWQRGACTSEGATVRGPRGAQAARKHAQDTPAVKRSLKLRALRIKPRSRVLRGAPASRAGEACAA